MVWNMKYRAVVSLNQGWEFVRSRVSRGWINGAAGNCDVELPHCWNSDDTFQDGVEYYRGPGGYRCCFNPDQSDSDLPDDGACRWHLVSEGFYGTGDVWLNGCRLGRVDGQYLGFRFDVTDLMKRNGENRLGIRLSNRCSKSVLPGKDMPDFLLYGGLSGRMRLECLPLVSIDANVTQIESKVDESGKSAEVDISGAVIGDACGYDISWCILNADGETVSKCSVGRPRPKAECEAGSIQSHKLKLIVDNPRLWDIESPQFYTAAGTLSLNGEVVDSVSIRFGIRTAEFRPYEGFFLNGRRLPLRGCNRHESMPGFGRALSLQQHRDDAALIKSMGLNFVRLSHYPQHPEFLDACDELGILVYAEIASWKSVRGGAWLKNACRQMRGMVVRDRNHPSVILWGMGNEGRHRGAYLKLYSICKDLDAGRAVTYAENHLYRARRKKTLGLPDVWGTNYEFDAMREGCEASRMKCVVVSECSNYPHTLRGDEESEQKQLSIIEHDLDRMEKDEFVAGFALWCFNDYATLRKKRYKRYSGLVDAQRVPKASAYWLSHKFGGVLTTEGTERD
jgi:beta-galactosidase